MEKPANNGIFRLCSLRQTNNRPHDVEMVAANMEKKGPLPTQASGMYHKDIANQFNINRTAITRIANGTRWANITGGPIVKAKG